MSSAQADRLAAAVTLLIHGGTIDAHSPAGDALLDYMHHRGNPVWTEEQALEHLAHPHPGASLPAPGERCTCPAGFGQVARWDCPRHAPTAKHTISGPVQ